MNSKIGNYNKQQLKGQLESMGLKGDETILIHSSMKSIGEVDGGADTVLDAWMEYFNDGLLLLPTHTWKTVNADNPVYNPQTTPSCVGLLTNMFMKRDGWGYTFASSNPQYGRLREKCCRISGR